MLSFKVIWKDEVRRCSLVDDSSMDKLSELISLMVGVDTAVLDIKFRDADGDLVTVGSDQEVDIAFAEAALIKKLPRFLVTGSGNSGTEVQQDTREQRNADMCDMSESQERSFKWKPNGPRGRRGSRRSKQQKA